MKKIFIQNSTLYLAGKNGSKKLLEEFQQQKEQVTVFEFKSKADLLQRIAWIETSQPAASVLIVADTAEKLEKIFFSGYKQIHAAGGAVFNNEGKLLMMFRRGKWDLPKGKVDKGETIREAAVREIEEETGVSRLKIKSPIRFLNGKQDCTFHTYDLNRKKILKATYWFRMSSSDKNALVPQESEGIELVEWCSKVKVKEYLKNSYHSIEEVVAQINQ